MLADPRRRTGSARPAVAVCRQVMTRWCDGRRSLRVRLVVFPKWWISPPRKVPGSRPRCRHGKRSPISLGHYFASGLDCLVDQGRRRPAGNTVRLSMHGDSGLIDNAIGLYRWRTASPQGCWRGGNWITSLSVASAQRRRQGVDFAPDGSYDAADARLAAHLAPGLKIRSTAGFSHPMQLCVASGACMATRRSRLAVKRAGNHPTHRPVQQELRRTVWA